ncbi:MAG: peptidylprolyl isomerase [Nanoarchaeota archaeon]|nr:peptidylprolyl isomerase [Nanoarchaeota archaeon]
MVIKEGDKVKLEYEGKLEDGTVFDSSKHGEHSHPLEFEVGAGQVIPGFEEAVKGMEKGEKKEFEIPAEKAYGERKEDLKKEIPKDSIPKSPEGREPEAGMVLMVQSPEGQSFPVKIDEVKESTIIIDLNHPLAGKKLIFNVEVADVKSK